MLAATYSARLSVLELEVPGQEKLAAGVMLEDPSADRLYIRMRRDWSEIFPEESEVLSAIEHDLASKAGELGAARVLQHLEDSLSNVLRVSDRSEVTVEQFDRALGRLYREKVSSTVKPFVTHLPRYSVAVAAGRFLDNQEVQAEGWEEAPAGLRLAPEMFVARIAGKSMEPVIPDQSLCVFRGGTVTGSRQGRLVLVEALGRGANDRYTVKRYRSERAQLPDGTWAHQSIRLEPINPDFEAWELDRDEDRYRIIAEFVRVLD